MFKVLFIFASTDSRKYLRNAKICTSTNISMFSVSAHYGKVEFREEALGKWVEIETRECVWRMQGNYIS